jgi:hypothetical protein
MRHPWRRECPRAVRRVLTAAASGILVLTLLPGPLPAIASTGVTVGTNGSSWAEPVGIRHVVGEVSNAGPDNAAQIRVTCTLYDATNHALASETQPVDADILVPTEKSPFDVLIPEQATYHHFGCILAGAPSTGAHPNHNFTTVITAVGTDDQGHQVVSGTVVNNNTMAATNVKVMLTSYDLGPLFTTVEDQVTTTLDGPIAGHSLPTPFSAITNDRPWDATPGRWAAITEAPSPWVSVPASLGFPDQIQGTTSAAQTVSVANIGTADLHVRSVQVSGDFALASDACTGVAVSIGLSCALGITLTPTGIGPRPPGSITVTDDAEGSPHVVALTGTGLKRPLASVSATALDFGSQLLGSITHLTVNVNSIGLDPLVVTGVGLDETTDFQVDSSACTAAPIPVGSSCTLIATFGPQSPTLLGGTITIAHNGRNGALKVTFSGTGVTPVAGAVLSRNAIDFGSQLVKTAAPQQTVRLTDNGTGPLQFTSVSASGDFSASSSCPGTLAVGDGCDISVGFTPTATGTRLGTLTVVDSVGTQTAALTGVGTTQTTFYFAEGFTGPGFTETLSLLALSQSGNATIDYYFAGGGHLSTVVPVVAGKTQSVDVNAAVGANQQVSARVTLPGAGVAERELHFSFGSWHGSTGIVGVVAPAAEWDFAEGSTLSVFSEYLTLQNPNATAVTVDLHYFTDAGASPTKTLTLPANSRTTVVVNAGDLTTNASCVSDTSCGVGPGIQGVSVQVRSRTLPIVAERPMYVNGFSFGSGIIRDGHVAFGANAPNREWDFAEGTTLNGFNEYLTLENPGGTPAMVSLNYIDQDGHSTVTHLTVAPLSRATVPVFSSTSSGGVGPGVPGVSVRVLSDQPIVAERPMYMVHNFGTGIVAGAHDVLGANSLGKLFEFAGASTAPAENDFLSIQNPCLSAAHLTVTYYTTTGPLAPRVFTVNASTRLTVQVFLNDGQGAGPGLAPVGIVVVSDQPVLVEKPTYGSSAAAYGATDTLGYSPAS